MNGVTVPAPVAHGWWQSLQQHIEHLLQKFNLTTRDLIHVLSFVCVGFVGGYLLKKYFRYFFIVTVAVVLAVILLDRFGVIVINWSSMQQVTGVDPHSTVQQCGQNLFNLIRNNIVLALSTFIGFIIGYSIG